MRVVVSVSVRIRVRVELGYVVLVLWLGGVVLRFELVLGLEIGLVLVRVRTNT